MVPTNPDACMLAYTPKSHRVDCLAHRNRAQQKYEQKYNSKNPCLANLMVMLEDTENTCNIF